ncbi:MAG: tyrosine-type recombinase/integrase [Bacteroidales bacterium]|nr:tyrosine-type recombinase/integrase [Bacteroidales bacterium]
MGRLKGVKTKSDYLEWNTLLILIHKLERDGENKFALLIAIGAYTGLRIGDILSLKWFDILEKDFLEINEQKTKKYRKLKLNENLKEIISRSFSKLHSPGVGKYVFINRFDTKPISREYVNRRLKEIFKNYNIKIGNVSSHTLRKSFGRRVFENNDNSEKSLIILGEMFNHASISTTKIYLGIREKEIFDVYDGL